MQSAEEVASAVYEILDEYAAPGEEQERLERASALIRARDREIVEACKKAIALMGNGYDDIGYGHMMSIREVSNILDSVLRSEPRKGD